jgi:flagellar hook-length control protein FliK
LNNVKAANERPSEIQQKPREEQKVTPTTTDGTKVEQQGEVSGPKEQRRIVSSMLKPEQSLNDASRQLTSEKARSDEAVKPVMKMSRDSACGIAPDSITANKKNDNEEKRHLRTENGEVVRTVESEAKAVQKVDSKEMVPESKEKIQEKSLNHRQESAAGSLNFEQDLEREVGTSEKASAESKTVNATAEKTPGAINTAGKPVGAFGEIHVNGSEPLLNTIRQSVEENPAAARLGNPLPNVEPEQMLRSIVREAAMSIGEGKSEMRMHLEPESLGTLVLKISVEDGKMNARIEVKNPEVQNVIEANLVKLKDSLAERGIHVERVDVSVSGEFPSRQQQERSLKKTNTPYRNRAYAVNSKEQPVAKYLGYNTIEYII